MGTSALPVAGSMLTKGLSTPGGLVANDHSRVALRVHFNIYGDADASARGGGRGGGGKAGGVAMVL